MLTSAEYDRLRRNLAEVRSQIAAAAGRAGRSAHDVRLVAVTKYVATDVIGALVELGVPDVGESRVQQLVERARRCGPAATDWPGEAPTPAAGPRWHMIGHLQRNKVKPLLEVARIVHSLDSERLAEALERQAAAAGVCVDVLIEVNVPGEASKTGIPASEVAALATCVGRHGHLRLRGLMTMAPYDPDPEHARPHFARLRALLEDLRRKGVVGPQCVHLSMGMSQDYAVAVEEGATLVRVGSALFAGLPTSDPRG